MAKRRNKTLRPPKRKRVTVRLVQEVYDGKPTEPYSLLLALRDEFRADLRDVKIGLAWRLGWRPDADGILRLGQCKKRGDLDRELDEYDFIILLNEEAFGKLTDEQKRRLIYHELEHAQLALDSNGEPKRDDRGRLVCRIRKHDIEDFREVIVEFGWQDNLSDLAKQAIMDADRPLLAECEKVPA